MTTPELDKRTYRDIVHQAKKLAKLYLLPGPGGKGTFEWESIREPVKKDDPAYRMLEIFARLMEILIRRLNKIPTKNFLNFLEMVGVEQEVGNQAQVPVTFLPAKSSPAGGYIPAGTRAATTQTDTADAQVFETRNSFYATPAKLKKAINLVPPEDKYSELTLVELPPKPEDLEDRSRTITAFKSDEPLLQDIDHVLYLGSEILFKVEEPVALALEISLSKGNKDIFANEKLVWKTYNEEKEKWEKIDSEYDNGSDPSKVKITFEPFNGTGKLEVNGIENHWLACFFIGDFTSEPGTPAISAISGNIIAEKKENNGNGNSEDFIGQVDSAFYNTNPIDISKPYYPFGDRPKYWDAFYIGSKQAFAPDVKSVTLTFTILPYNNDYIKEIFKNLPKNTTKNIITKVTWQYLDNEDKWRHLATFQHTMSITKNNDSTLSTPSHETIKYLDEKETSHETIDKKNDGTLIGNGSSKEIEITFSDSEDEGPFEDIGLKEVNKEENYWLRALIRSRDPYGKDAYLEPTNQTKMPFVVIGPTYIPPIIEKVNVTFSYKNDQPTQIPVDSIQTKNNFVFTVHKEAFQSLDQPFTPFIPITSYAVGNNTKFIDTKPALYMGFDSEFGDVYISLFIHLSEAFSPAGYALEQGNPHITWEYAASDYSWKPLDVKDNTANLTASGTLAFTGPGDSIKVSLFKSLCQYEETPEDGLYWYRARLAHGYYDYSPQITGIYLNTVMADNRVVSRADQVVGSGNGTANQKLTLIRVPVLAGEIWVRETEPPGEEELENHLQEFAHSRENKKEIEIPDLVHKVTAGDGKEENWVQWLKVPNFLASGPRSRHYTLDAVNGQITFGNNEHGLIPPADKDNIIIKNYLTGGGEQANKAASPLAVKELKSSLPYVDKVFNVQYAVGGSNPWTLEQTMAFGPQSVKNRGRAVTIEDYEWMVLQHFSQVARTRCIPTRVPGEGGSLLFKPGAATLIIVPKTTDPKPQPPKGLLKNIRDYLRQKALGNIFEHIHVIGPDFKEINISAVVKPLRPGETSIVERRIIKNLEDFFHPLTGGEQKNGWAFGRDVYISEVYAVIERTQGVNYVKNAWFTNKPGEESLEIGNNCLVYSGTHKITME